MVRVQRATQGAAQPGETAQPGERDRGARGEQPRHRPAARERGGADREGRQQAQDDHPDRVPDQQRRGQ
jgi:hypothetical protein